MLNKDTMTKLPRLVVSMFEDDLNTFKTKADELYSITVDNKVNEETKKSVVDQFYVICSKAKIETEKVAPYLNYICMKFLGTKDITEHLIECLNCANDMLAKGKNFREIEPLERIVAMEDVPMVIRARYYNRLINIYIADQENIVENLPKIKEYCDIVEKANE